MKNNEPEGFSVYNTATGESEGVIRLSDYEALRDECEKLRKASSELANWCFHEVGADIEITPGLKQVMDITGDAYDSQ